MRIRSAICTAACILCFAGIVKADPGAALSPDDTAQIEKLHSAPAEADRVAAARVIGSKHDARFMDALAAGLADPVLAVQIASLKSIGDIGNLRALDLIKTSASDANTPVGLRLEACTQLVKVAKSQKSGAAVLALDQLRGNADPAVQHMAETSLIKSIETVDTEVLNQLAGSGTPAMQKMVAQETARRGSGPTPSVAGTAIPVAPSAQGSTSAGAFTADDVRLLNDWRRELDAQLGNTMADNGKASARLPLHTPARDRLERVNRYLNTARHKLSDMTITDIGVAVEREAASASQRARNAAAAARLTGAAAQSLADAPATETTRIFGDGHVETTVDHNEFGVALFSLMSLSSSAQSRSLAARAEELEKIQSSLSPRAREAIEARRKDLAAHPHADGIDPTNPVIPPEDPKGDRSTPYQRPEPAAPRRTINVRQRG